MSEGAPVALWSDLQLSWLQAMGHVVYLDGAAEPVTPEPVAVERVEAPAPRAEPRPAHAHAPMPPPAPARRAAPPAEAATEPVQASHGGPVRRTRVGMPDRLQIALLRATGCDPNDPRIQQQMADWPLAELRAYPTAKRRLWPQLRALRRGAMASR